MDRMISPRHTHPMTALKSIRANAVAAVLLLLMGSLVLGGCGTSSDDSKEHIQTGADVLVRLAASSYQSGWPGKLEYTFGDLEWSTDYETVIDNSRMPVWAEEMFDNCVYWEQTLSYTAMNMNRQRGEPARWHPEGKAWGWVLVSNEATHVLELGFEFEGDEPHLFVEAWDAPAL